MRIEKRHLGVASVLAIIMGASIPPAKAVDIQMTFNSGSSDAPSYDADGSKLQTLMGGIESYLEDIFEHPSWTLQVEFYYSSAYEQGVLAACTSLGASAGKPTRCRIEVATSQTWYLDTAPLENSEYTMSQTLYGDLTSSQKSSQFSGSPNSLLEVCYSGTALSSAPSAARNGYDLFSVLLHEMGHGLGMNGLSGTSEAADADYDFNAALVWGGTVAAKSYSSDNRYHLAAEALMYPYFGAGERRLYSATDVLAVQTAAEWSNTYIDLPRKDFYSASSAASFNARGNWEGYMVPDAEDIAYVRHGGTATLTAAASAGSLLVSGGSTVSLGAYALAVGDTCSVGTATTTGSLVVGSGGSLSAGALDVAAQGQVSLEGSGEIHVESLSLTKGSTVLFDVTSSTLFGRIDVAGEAELAGTLGVSLPDTLAMEAGAGMEIMTFGSRSGAFDTVNVEGASLVPVYSDTALTLYSVLPGDANLDWVVDDLDASILAAHWQQTSGASWSDGDFTGDGQVNDLDASVLAAHWEASTLAAAVPEPGTLVLLAGAAVLLRLRGRSRP